MENLSLPEIWDCDWNLPTGRMAQSKPGALQSLLYSKDHFIQVAPIQQSGKTPKTRCAKLMVTCPEWLATVTAAKGGCIKVLTQGWIDFLSWKFFARVIVLFFY